MTFISETTAKARTTKKCCACNQIIEVGSQYVRWVGTEDGFQSSYYHVECREAEIAYNKLIKSQWDEWVGLDEIDVEDFDWLCNLHPAVAARFGWSMYDWRVPDVVGGTLSSLVMRYPVLYPETGRQE